MVKCEYCGKDMNDSKGCSCSKVKINDIVYDRIPFGKEIIWNNTDYKKRCLDCNCAPGYYHHPNCEVEESPETHDQLLIESISRKNKLEFIK